jgi:TldD protein
MPVRYDPFTIPIEEKCDFAGAWIALAQQFNRHVSATHHMSFTRQEHAVATSEGAYFTQTLYESGGVFAFILYQTQNGSRRYAQVDAHGLQAAGAGWEHILDAKIPDQFPRMLAEAEEQLRGHPTKPGDIGRYDVVFDAASMAHLLDRTIGTATQLDRAMGYEANAGGTSYLGPKPEKFLGTAIASKAVTVTANRSLAKGLATVRWDDEGVEPVPFTVVKEGTLIDYQTTREQAAWLAPWYQAQGMPVRSHGCASADSALSVTMQHTPNLALEPAAQDTSFEDLVADTKRGLAIIGGQPEVSFNAAEGVMTTFHRCREIIDGKLGKDVLGLAPLFNSTELWKNVVAVGGAGSVETFASGESKGEPSQYTSYSIQAVPAKVTNVAFIQPERRR